MDYGTIQRLDTLALWKSVDETQGTPILPHLTEIGSIQHQTLRTVDVVEQFVDEMVTFSMTNHTPTEQVYLSFRDWMDKFAPRQHIPPRNRVMEQVTELLFRAAPNGLYDHPRDLKKKEKVQMLPCVIAKSQHHAGGLIFTSVHQSTFAVAS